MEKKAKYKFTICGPHDYSRIGAYLEEYFSATNWKRNDWNYNEQTGDGFVPSFSALDDLLITCRDYDIRIFTF